jgi:PAS domain S-box-containing protein
MGCAQWETTERSGINATGIDVKHSSLSSSSRWGQDRALSDRAKTKRQLLEELQVVRRQLADLEGIDAARDQAVDTLRRFEKVVETMQLGVTITDLDGTILYTNPADAQLHGYEQDELAGKDVGVFAPKGRRRPLTLEELNAMSSWSRESVNARKDGTTFPAQLMSDVVRDGEGVPIAVVTTCEDITIRKSAEEILQERLRKSQQIAVLTRENRELRARLTKSMRTYVIRFAIFALLATVSAAIGAMIGGTPERLQRPIPIPLNPSDTVIPPLDSAALELIPSMSTR